jgi:hypothetical protein
LAELAKGIGKSKGLLSLIENGHSAGSRETLENIAKFFRLPHVGLLFGRADPPINECGPASKEAALSLFREMNGATTMTINLKLFCGPNDPKHPFLEEPFSAGAWTYATDGHIAVRVSRLEDVAENSAVPAGVLEGTSRLFEQTRKPRYKQAPEFELQEPFEWKEELECHRCRGTGKFHIRECPDCNCKCFECDGTGIFTVPNVRTTSIGKALYRSKYISLMRSLPQLELGRPHRSKPLPFRFDGGEGLLMPCRP